jgi:Tol biopolymer transport system component
MWAIAAVGLIAVGAGLGALVSSNAKPPAPPPIVTRFPVMLGEGQNFTNMADTMVAMSADGSRLAYIANRRLHLRTMGDLEAQPIRGTESNPRHPLFSPDGLSVAYYSVDEAALKRIAITGGAPVTICSLRDFTPNPPFGAHWSGEAIFFGVSGGTNHGIARVGAGGGKPEMIVKVNAGEFADGPQLLDDGEHLLFTLARSATTADRWDKAQIVVQSLRTGERKTLVDGGSDGHAIGTGHLVYALGGVVFAVRFDARKLQVIGGPVPVIEGVRRSSPGSGSTTGAVHLSISRNGSLVYVPGPVSVAGGQQMLALVDRKGAVAPLKLPPGAYRDPRMSPDGKRVAFGSDDDKEAIVWVYDIAGTSAMRRLTLGGKNRYPVWSPDGQHIAFQSDREDDAAIFQQRADGSGTVERLTKPEQGWAHVPESWSPDGKALLFSASKEAAFSSLVLWLEERKTTPFDDVRSTQPINAVFSPDGKWIAYTSSSGAPGTGGSQVYVQPFPPTGATYQISKGNEINPHHPFWSRDGRELYYIPGQGLLAVVAISTRPSFAFSDPVQLPRGTPAFTEGGPGNTRQNDSALDARIIAVVNTSQTQGPQLTAQHMQVVINWFEELKQRLP